MNVRYHLSENTELFAGINNVFDKEPPRLITGVAGNNTGTETNAAVYDAIGQRWYAGVRMKF